MTLSSFRGVFLVGRMDLSIWRAHGHQLKWGGRRRLDFDENLRNLGIREGLEGGIG